MNSVRFIFVLTAMFAASCASAGSSAVRPSDAPRKMVWAWERPEDLRFLDPAEYGVAFLAQSLTLSSDEVEVKLRRQPLRTAPEAFVVAVTRIESVRGAARPALSETQARRTADLVLKTLELPNVKGIQVDFDALESERLFYTQLLRQIRAQLPAGKGLTMTALASWCTGDGWLGDLPVDEAVPMIFEMGTDAAEIRKFLGSGRDLQEPLCRQSYGVSVDERNNFPAAEGRRIYFFSSRAWRESDLTRLR